MSNLVIIKFSCKTLIKLIANKNDFFSQVEFPKKVLIHILEKLSEIE